MCAPLANRALEFARKTKYFFMLFFKFLEFIIAIFVVFFERIKKLEGSTRIFVHDSLELFVYLISYRGWIIQNTREILYRCVDGFFSPCTDMAYVIFAINLFKMFDNERPVAPIEVHINLIIPSLSGYLFRA